MEHSVDDFESWLASKIAGASRLPQYFWPTFAEQEIAADDYPRRTLFRLNHAARSNYAAALSSLLDPATAFGAFALSRPLIEAWLHVRFIYSDGAEAADCRALALERGMAHWMLDFVKSLTPNDATDIDLLENRLADVRSQLLHRGGSGEEFRDFRLKKDLDDVAKGEPFARSMWKAASAASHGFGDDFIMRDDDDGGASPVTLSPSARFKWWHDLVSVYANITSTSLDIVAAPDAEMYHRCVLELLEDDFVVAMRAGLIALPTN